MIRSLAEDKALGHFSHLISRRHWSIVQCDVVVAIQDFLIHGQMPSF